MKTLLIRTFKEYPELIYASIEEDANAYLKYLNDNYGNVKDEARERLFEQKKKRIPLPSLKEEMYYLKNVVGIDKVFIYDDAGYRGWKLGSIQEIINLFFGDKE